MLKEITEDTLFDILKLEVNEAQKNFVAPNSVSIAQAYFSKNAWFRGIYHDGKPVGFVMLHIDRKKAEYWVWRFMVAKEHQGKGYGQMAMQEIIELVKKLPKAKELCLSYVPGKGNPSHFYKKMGFVETGEWDDDGKEKIMKYDFRI